MVHCSLYVLKLPSNYNCVNIFKQNIDGLTLVDGLPPLTYS